MRKWPVPGMASRTASHPHWDHDGDGGTTRPASTAANGRRMTAPMAMVAVCRVKVSILDRTSLTTTK